MDNLKRPAYPCTVQWQEGKMMDGHQTEVNQYQEYGFTKLEKAALIIAAGMLGTINTIWIAQEKDSARIISKDAVMIAKAVLEEANK